MSDCCDGLIYCDSKVDKKKKKNIGLNHYGDLNKILVVQFVIILCLSGSHVVKNVIYVIRVKSKKNDLF